MNKRFFFFLWLTFAFCLILTAKENLPTEAQVNNAKEIALKYIQIMAKEFLSKGSTGEEFLHEDALWPGGDTFIYYVSKPNFYVKDIEIAKKNVNFVNPKDEYIITITIGAETVASIDYMLNYKDDKRKVSKRLELSEQNGQFLIICDLDNTIYFVSLDSAIQWAEENKNRNKRFENIYMRLKDLSI